VTTEALASFQQIAQEYYPGSSRPIIRHPNRSRDTGPEVTASWDRKPRTYPVGGVEREFFTIGQLAEALGRKPVTLRKWEREGIIPKATFRAPSEHVQGVRRLYSREQVEGIVKIAKEEGVLVSHQTPITQTQFTNRVVALFTSLTSGA